MYLPLDLLDSKRNLDAQIIDFFDTQLVPSAQNDSDNFLMIYYVHELKTCPNHKNLKLYLLIDLLDGNGLVTYGFIVIRMCDYHNLPFSKIYIVVLT